MCIKQEIRQRDSFRCARCAMSAEESIEKLGRTLDVHRIIPGVDYQYMQWCVTLCVDCHKLMPRKIQDIIFWDKPHLSGAVGVIMNQFHPRSSDAYVDLANAVQAIKEKYDGIVIETFGEVLPPHFASDPIVYEI